MMALFFVACLSPAQSLEAAEFRKIPQNKKRRRFVSDGALVCRNNDQPDFLTTAMMLSLNRNPFSIPIVIFCHVMPGIFGSPPLLE